MKTLKLLRIAALFFCIMASLSCAASYKIPKNYEQSLIASCEHGSLHVRIYYEQEEKWLATVFGWDRKDRVLLFLAPQKDGAKDYWYISDDKGGWIEVGMDDIKIGKELSSLYDTCFKQLLPKET